jgi:hypothetical protein
VSFVLPFRYRHHRLIDQRGSPSGLAGEANWTRCLGLFPNCQALLRVIGAVTDGGSWQNAQK